MGLAISRRLDGYDPVNQLELRHLALSDLETLNVQSGAPPALGGATWSRKVQVGRIFGIAPHVVSRGRLRRLPLRALLLIGVLVACKVYLLPVMRCSWVSWATLPDGITSIGSKRGRRLCQACTHVTLPAGLTSIGRMAFFSCHSLASITLPDGITSIGPAAFSGCISLASITLPDGLTSIGQETFYGCGSLRLVALPASLTSIGVAAFGVCQSLASISLPDGFTSIGVAAFVDCPSLTSISLPNGLTSIGERAFAGCSNLVRVNVSSGCVIGREAFIGTPRCKTRTRPTRGCWDSSPLPHYPNE